MCIVLVVVLETGFEGMICEEEGAILVLQSGVRGGYWKKRDRCISAYLPIYFVVLICYF